MPGHIFFVMDLADDVTGTPGSTDPSYQPATLQSRLQTGPLTPEECWRRTGELLAGLAALHDAGMVHRDVKPANCLFVGGELKLADFGLLTEADRQMSRVGTVSYMPPDGAYGRSGRCVCGRPDGLRNDHRLAGELAFPASASIRRSLPMILTCEAQSAGPASLPIRSPIHAFANAREMLDELTRPEAVDPGRLFRRSGWIGVCLCALCSPSS